MAAVDKNLLRSLKPKPAGLIDFSSNDYLGLANHPKLKEVAAKACKDYPTSSSASRLLSGDSELFHQLEEKVAILKKKEAALVFNSGYQANVGIISSLYSKADLIFADKLVHASIIDGIKLSGAKLFRFKHNDLGNLEELLKNNRSKGKQALIITESVFSMDGDFAPLDGLVKLKEQYDCQLMVDEAHATGIFGENGQGLAPKQTDIVMGTFSKALGSFGAYVATSKSVVDQLINTCRSFIYSTALPHQVVAVNLAGIDLIKAEPFRRKQLLEKTAYFRQKLGLDKGSQIVPCIVGDASKAIELSQKFQAAGFWVLPIRPPTVPQGSARLRFSLSYNHSLQDLDKVIGLLQTA